MAITPPSPDIASAARQPAARGDGIDPEQIARKWTALCAAAAAIAELTGEPHGPDADAAAFAAALAPLAPRRRRLIDENLSDLVAVMEPGLVALLSIQKRGGDASTSARALWREFVAARDVVQSLIG